ncbi:hypothetical protein R1A27_34440 (plasmid) [Methylobacterium sp. NMS12]|uniref:hypothetical protein n=1 Tax=Methylobacterium sp. NMS12 TaxID=3079766 RepID=UPI003F8843CD
MEPVCADSFRHLTLEALIRKVSPNEIALPLVRIEVGAKCAKVQLDRSCGLPRPRMEAATRSATSSVDLRLDPRVERYARGVAHDPAGPHPLGSHGSRPRVRGSALA